VGLVPSVSSGGFIIFIDYGGVIGVFRALLRHYNKAAKTIVSLYISDCGLLSFDTGVSLALSSSRNYSILALVAIRSI
jgi:hypothetical protein